MVGLLEYRRSGFVAEADTSRFWFTLCTLLHLSLALFEPHVRRGQCPALDPVSSLS